MYHQELPVKEIMHIRVSWHMHVQYIVSKPLSGPLQLLWEVCFCCPSCVCVCERVAIPLQGCNLPEILREWSHEDVEDR